VLSPMPGTVRPMSRISKNSGIVSASTGTICATMKSTSTVVRKRNRNFVSATAARNAIAPASATTHSATTALLRK